MFLSYTTLAHAKFEDAISYREWNCLHCLCVKSLQAGQRYELCKADPSSWEVIGSCYVLCSPTFETEISHDLCSWPFIPGNLEDPPSIVELQLEDAMQGNFAINV